MPSGVALLRYSIAMTAGTAGLALAVRAWHGPYSFGLSVNSPMNAQSIVGAALVLLILSGKRTDSGKSISRLGHRDWLWIAGLYTAALLAHWPSLNVGFVADDYAHILTVSNADGPYFAGLFTKPAADRFFRPMGMISYFVDFQWAGFSPVRWHLAGVLLHGINAALLYAICRLLGLARVWAFFSAALFAVHGSRPEAVTWVSARFDLVATLFVLVTVLLFVYPMRRLSFILLAATCALLSKESAYVLPLLLTALVFSRRELRTGSAYRAVAATFALTAAVFLYRWILLSGIGGYYDAQGKPTIFLTNIWLFTKAIFLRLWAVLFVPLNWTDPLGISVKVTLSLMIAALLILAIRGAAGPLAKLGLALALIAALPVYHLLLIGPDLEKSRVVYLSSVGFAIFCGAMFQSLRRRIAYAAAAAVLSFQVAALWHNLATWDRVSRIHATACDTLARAALQSGTDVVAVGMPNTHDGVYMLLTGLPECVEIRHGVPASRLRLVPSLPDATIFAAGAPIFVWNADAARVQTLQSPQ